MPSLPPQPLQGAQLAHQIAHGAIQGRQASHVIHTRLWWEGRTFLECRCGWSGECYPGTAEVCMVGETEAEYAAEFDRLYAYYRERLRSIRRRSDEDAVEREQAIVRAAGAA